MATTRTRSITREAILAKLRADLDRGILDDRLESFVPLDAYGPPGPDELDSVNDLPVNGALPNGKPPKRRSQSPASHGKRPT